MATLAADKPRVFETGHDEMLNGIPMVDNDIIYDGAAVGDSSGLARPLVGGDGFMGFCIEQADNTGPGHAAGAINVKVKSRGVVTLNVAGVSSADDYGAIVYATDDDTFTLTASGGSAIGRVFRWKAGTTCQVYFQATALQDQA